MPDPRELPDTEAKIDWKDKKAEKRRKERIEREREEKRRRKPERQRRNGLHCSHH